VRMKWESRGSSTIRPRHRRVSRTSVEPRIISRDRRICGDKSLLLSIKKEITIYKIIFYRVDAINWLINRFRCFDATFAFIDSEKWIYLRVQKALLGSAKRGRYGTRSREKLIVVNAEINVIHGDSFFITNCTFRKYYRKSIEKEYRGAARA
jgi:hypothetical protein